MKGESLILSTLVAIFCLTTGHALAADITIDGTASGSAVGGKGTTKEQLDAAEKYIKRYSGPTQFTATYNISFKADKTVDSTKSTVSFKTIKYTVDGKEVKSSFTTSPITITSVKIKDSDTTKIESFTFESLIWYPGADTAGVTNNTLSGLIDLDAGTSSYTASYIDKTTLAVYTYNVSGKTPTPKPIPDPLPDEFGNPEIFSPAPATVPEPTSTLSLLALGTLGAASTLKRKLTSSKSAEKQTTKVS